MSSARSAMVVAVVVAVGCLALSACGKPSEISGKPKGDQPFPVEIATVAERSVTQSLHAPGTIEAFETVQITTRVAGSLDRLAVAEGDLVAIGDVIATIDAERYRIALNTAEAQRTRAEAVCEDAQASSARRDELAKTDRVRQEEAQQARLRLAQANADLAIAKAAVERAALDLKDATVTAPIAGIIQRREARTGAYLPVGAPLVTLVQRDPLEVRFSVLVADAARLTVGQVITAQPRGSAKSLTATIRLIADAVDAGTRLVPVVARLATDAPRDVRPGSFAEIQVVLPPRLIIAVPSLALRASERGTLAYIVDGDILRERVVTLDGQSDAGELVVKDGLHAGDRLAVRAADGLRDGMKVTISDPGAGSRVGADPGKSGKKSAGTPVLETPEPKSRPAASGSAAQ